MNWLRVWGRRKTREIRYRGKDIKTGEWAYGDYIAGFISPNNGLGEFYGGKTYREGMEWCEGCFYRIDPKTVGQYTGLRDKNGVEIYEGDIVRLDKGCQPLTGILRFGEYNDTSLAEDKEHLGFYFEFVGERVSWLRAEALFWLSRYDNEVIGNVHEGVGSNDK